MSNYRKPYLQVPSDGVVNSFETVIVQGMTLHISSTDGSSLLQAKTLEYQSTWNMHLGNCPLYYTDIVGQWRRLGSATIGHAVLQLLATVDTIRVCVRSPFMKLMKLKIIGRSVSVGYSAHARPSPLSPLRQATPSHEGATVITSHVVYR